MRQFMLEREGLTGPIDYLEFGVSKGGSLRGGSNTARTRNRPSSASTPSRACPKIGGYGPREHSPPTAKPPRSLIRVAASSKASFKIPCRAG